MYLEHFHLTHSPFMEEPDTEIFFPGARREEICQSLILDVLAGKQLIKLVGREGSGKTLICRLIVERLPSEYEVVSIDNPVGSFDDLLRIVCLELGMDPRGKHDSTNFFEELERLLASKRAARIKTVLIIDEAEKLFLATLERLVRHIGESPEDLGITIILAGRPGLDANLDQLSVFCAQVDFQAGYFLADLTENETRQYLRFRLQAAGMRRDQHEDVFTEGAVSKIFDSARGNLRLTNILAEESLQASCSEKSFMVLLDHVEPESSDSVRIENKLIEIYELLHDNKRLAGALAGVVVLVFAIGLLLSGNGESPSAIEPAGQARGTIPSDAPAHQPAPIVAPDSSGVQTTVSAGDGARNGDKLFRERLGASASWLAGMYRGGYTIQLMMLMSNEAQASITNTLVQDEYYPLRDKLFILRKKTTPPTLFVFYGMYDSLEAARESRNDMPVFLRKHHPYPLSITEALKKTGN